MEFLKDYLAPKSFSGWVYAMSIVHFFCGVILTGITENLRSGEKRKFACSLRHSATAVRPSVENECFSIYNQRYNSPLPLFGFVIISFGTVVVVSVVYSLCVKFRVEQVERSATAVDEPPQSAEPTNHETREETRYVFYSYTLHLVARFGLGILFAVLQYQVFYRLGFQDEFTCRHSRVTVESKTTADMYNFTSTICHNSSASEKAVWGRVVLILNVVFALIVLGEVFNLGRRVWNSRTSGIGFAYDSQFCSVYLLRNPQSTYGQTLNSFIRTGIDIYRSQILNHSPGIDSRYGPRADLNKTFVELIIHTGRAPHEFTKEMNRHEIHDTYLKPTEKSIRIENIKDLFYPNEDTEGTTPRTILVVGRPGIGKSVLARKIMHDWASGVDRFYEEKIAILLKFRWFNAEELKKMTLTELLRLGTQLNNTEFEELFQAISVEPTKAILVFDGLDECKENENCFEEEEKFANDPSESMPVMALFIKLVLGKLLQGATVLMTTRPTADNVYSKLDFKRNVEILGFTRKKIEEFIEKFCENNDVEPDTHTKMWDHINRSPELLNLCYIPVNCFIVCASLLTCIMKLAITENYTLPTTLTELYKQALNYFLECHSNKRVDTLNDLGHLAFRGVDNQQLIFDEEINEEMAKSGLLLSLPNVITSLKKQYCFIHLTIQEFLASRHVVETKSPSEISQFITSKAKYGKWHLVIQFVAGLLGDKMKVDVSYKACLLGFLEYFPYNVFKGNTPIETRKIGVFMIKCLRELKDDEVVKATASKLSKNLIHNSLFLHGLDMSPADCSAVMSILENMHTFRYIDLSRNRLGNSGCLELSNVLKGRCVEQLLINGCEVADSGLELLVTAMQNVKCNLDHHLICLRLMRNFITDKGVALICDFLRNKYCNVSVLDLSQNEITDKGISLICDFLRNEHQHCNLAKLCLGHNKVTDEGFSLLCDVLKNVYHNVEELDISVTDVTDKGIESLCGVLKNDLCSLTHLGLNVITVTDKGVALLCDALKNEHCTVTDLHLRSNDITDIGVESLCDVLKNKHSKLTYLDLSLNPITRNGVSLLCDVVKNRDFGFSQLIFDRITIVDKGVSWLEKVQISEDCLARNLVIR